MDKDKEIKSCECIGCDLAGEDLCPKAQAEELVMKAEQALADIRGRAGIPSPDIYPLGTTGNYTDRIGNLYKKV